MNLSRSLWVAAVVLIVSPYAALMVAGGVWCYEHDLLLAYFAASALVTGIGWLGLRVLARRHAEPLTRGREAGEGWPPRDRQAWEKIERLAARGDAGEIEVNSPEDAWILVRKVLAIVARHYHPDSTSPELETPLPDVLYVTERVSRDLREVVERRVPGSHIITLADLGRMRRLADTGQRVYFWYRLARFAVAPGRSLLAELQRSAGSATLRQSVDDIRRWAIGFAIRRAGKYAIELYSGRAMIEDERVAQFESKCSRRDRRSAQRTADRYAEPLRVLVVGGKNVGKSSLVHALCESLPPLGELPSTRRVEARRLAREDFGEMLILDTPGYEGREGSPLEKLNKHLDTSDLILLVCSAEQGVLASDRQLLEDLDRRQREHPEKLMPPCVVVGTFIDCLPPEDEWKPPYDLEHPHSAKSRSIVEFTQSLAEQLNVDSELVAPACTHPDRLYNLEDGPWSVAARIARAIDAADHLRRLRIVDTYRREQRWQHLRDQAAENARQLWQLGKAWMQHRRNRPRRK